MTTLANVINSDKNLLNFSNYMKPNQFAQENETRSRHSTSNHDASNRFYIYFPHTNFMFQLRIQHVYCRHESIINKIWYEAETMEVVVFVLFPVLLFL